MYCNRTHSFWSERVLGNVKNSPQFSLSLSPSPPLFSPLSLSLSSLSNKNLIYRHLFPSCLWLSLRFLIFSFNLSSPFQICNHHWRFQHQFGHPYCHKLRQAPNFHRSPRSTFIPTHSSLTLEYLSHLDRPLHHEKSIIHIKLLQITSTHLTKPIPSHNLKKLNPE